MASYRKNVKAILDRLARVKGGDYHTKFGYGRAAGWKAAKWTSIMIPLINDQVIEVLAV
jgi:hypothetical protein